MPFKHTLNSAQHCVDLIWIWSQECHLCFVLLIMYLKNSSSPSSTPSSVVTTNLFSLCLSLVLICYCYCCYCFQVPHEERLYGICLPLFLTYFISLNALVPFILSEMARFHLLWLNNIPLYIYMCVYPIFCIYSFIDGHLDWFHILAIVNNVAVNMGVHIFFQVSIFVFFR